ncbi:MAG: GNAT family N-acetyltransferase [Acidimicrobiia bacterium]
MSADDVEDIAGVMARAFWDDPLQVWAFPDATTRLAKLDAMFAMQIRAMAVPSGESYTDESRSTGAFWMPPGREQPEPNALEAMEVLRAIVGDALERIRVAFAAMQDAHPPDPHFYLAGLGTTPERQGQGLGSAVIEPVLDRCDTERIPAYLESTKEQNIAFYEHHGFAVTGTIAPAPDGPTMWTMWRAPRGT